tara:strand:+ start:2463 stop:2933 length:471 start_codon:yes stop_codon:yes gene_type:complete
MDINVYDSYGRFYDDFSIGMSFKHWPGKTITQSDNHNFCMLTMNNSPLHLDVEYMKNHQHKKPIVVGLLTLSLIVGMTVQDLSGKAIANLGYESVKHEGPVFEGDTLYAVSEILDMRESNSNPDAGIVKVETLGYNQNNEKILSLRRNIYIPKKNK